VTGNLRLIVESVLLVVAALLPIVNPFGGAPMFLALTADVSREVRAELASKIAINALVLLVASLFVGTYVLDFFGLSVPIVQVAGGIVVCAASWDLLRSEHVLNVEIVSEPTDIGTRAFYPLTMPLTVGPGSISVAITLGSQRPPTSDLPQFFAASTAAIASLVAMSLTVYLCYRFAPRLVSALGRGGTNVVVRLSAFILLCIGIQILWNGVKDLAHLT